MLLVESDYYNFKDIYFFIKEDANSYPIYYNKEKKLYLWYNFNHIRWYISKNVNNHRYYFSAKYDGQPYDIPKDKFNLIVSNIKKYTEE